MEEKRNEKWKKKLERAKINNIQQNVSGCKMENLIKNSIYHV